MNPASLEAAIVAAILNCLVFVATKTDWNLENWRNSRRVRGGFGEKRSVIKREKTRSIALLACQ